MVLLLAHLMACGPRGSEEAPPAPAPAEPVVAETRGSAARGAAVQASRGVPVHARRWEGSWTLGLVADDPAAPEVSAFVEATGVRVRKWDGRRPAARRGEVVVVFVRAGADPKALAGGMRGGSEGDVVLVLPPGDPAWAEAVATEIPWAGVSVVDTSASLSLWVDPARADARAAGVVAAREVCEHYRLPWTRIAGPWAPALDEVLGPADPADLTAKEVRTRAEAARAGGADALVSDAEVAVRLGVASSTADPATRVRLAADPDPLVRARAADRLDDVAALDRLVDDPSSVVRVVATHRLANLGVEAAQAPLARAALSPDAYQRWKAASGLQSVPTLLRLLSDPDIDVRRAAAHRLGTLKDPAALDALVAMLEEPNSFVRRWAAEALGRIGHPRAIPALRDAARDPTALVAAAAAGALSTMGEPTHAPEYVPPPRPKNDAEIDRWAASRDATLRKDTAKFLAGRADAAKWLEPLAADADSEVRKSAIEAFGWDPGVGPRLVAALADPDPDVVVTALDGLRRGRSGTVASLGPLARHADAEVRLRAVEALAALGPSPELEACLSDGDERIRAATVGVYPKRVAPDDPSVLVRRAAGLAGGDALTSQAPDTDGWYWARGVIAREDDLVHLRFSWNDESERPDAYRTLRPPVIREYGHPDRG